MPRNVGLDELRRHAVARSLFKPTTLGRAILRLGFVQADPIRAPARAQDLTLRHRVVGYRAGDLERRYASLAVEEDCLVNYGFLPRAHLALMHPRAARHAWDAETQRRADELLVHVREHGPLHPRDVELHFAPLWGKQRRVDAWGGFGNAVTHLLDGMHYRGLLRVARRDAGTRVYAAVAHPAADDSEESRARRAAALVGLVIEKYAPLPAASLGPLVSMLGYGAPHLTQEMRAALHEAKRELPHARIDGMDWYWPTGEQPASRRHAPADKVRLLAPFDPVVWDRRRFELLWGWAYRFEAYTPAARRQLGYYALPLLWRERVVGWGNVAVKAGVLDAQLGFVDRAALREAGFKPALREELASLASCLGLAPDAVHQRID